EHDHGGRAGLEPLLRRMAGPLPRAADRARLRRRPPVVPPQDGGRPLLLHLAPRHGASLPVRPAHGLRVEGPRPAGHPQHPRHRARHGVQVVVRMDLVLFYFFAAVTLGSALVVVGQRHPTYSAFALIVTLCSLSAVFGLLGSPFIAVLQVVVYAGAIMVLFLFTIMLLNVKREDHEDGQAAFKATAVTLAALLTVQVGSVLMRTGPRPPVP